MKICLNAIVKNESARIERMLRSVAPHIDAYVILDTGSTDDTVRKIHAFFDAKGIPGETHTTRFFNFEQARNEALVHARQSALAFDGILLCDADMELVVTDPQWLAEKTGPSYDMRQTAGGLSYWNRRILNRRETGLYRGVTHEYLDVETAGQVHGAHFVDHADGANRKDKFKRDIKLLRDAIKKDPNDARNWFYLAQSYRDAGKHRSAAHAYKHRVELGGWDEEVWNSQFNYAHCLGAVGDSGGFIRELLVAFNMRPCRAETIYDLAKHYREKGMNAASVVFSEAGMKIPYPNDVLFVSDYVYHTGLREEFSICAFYDATRREQGFEVCNALALDRKGTPHSREQARSNLFYYVKPLAAMVGYCSRHHLPFTAPDGYVAMNPSITNVGDGRLAAIIRTVNYTISDGGHYLIRGTDGTATGDNPIHTRNFLSTVNPDFTLGTAYEVLPPADLPLPQYDMVCGFEDMRLFFWNGHPWVSSCVRELNKEGWCEQVLARIAPESYQLTDWRKILPAERVNEKNWAPMVLPGDGLRFVYRLGTLMNDQAQIVHNAQSEFDVGHVSGGTQALAMEKWGDKYLSVVHEARVRPDNGQRWYQHRFAYFDGRGILLALSKPFVFHDKQIEFAAGIAHHPNGSQIIISYGVRDCEAWAVVVDCADVIKLLFP